MVWFLAGKVRSAIESSDLNRLQQWIEGGAQLEMDLDSGKTMLFYAVEKLQPAVVDFLLQKGADANARNASKWTPMHRAAYNGQIELVAKLLKAGGDPNLRTSDGRTVHAMAVRNGHLEMAEMVKPFMKNPAQLFDIPEPPKPAAPRPKPFPEMPPHAEEEGSNWKKLPGERIAHVAVEKAIGYRITEIFNFSAREKTTLYHNLDTKSETVETRGFADIGDKSALEAALAELQKRGGTSDSASISGLDKKKLSPTP